MTIDLCNFDIEVIEEMKTALNDAWLREFKSPEGPGKKSERLILAIAQVSAAIDVVKQREKVNIN